MYLVYLLKEKRTGKVIYVGSSARPAARMKEHCQSLREGNKQLDYPLYRYMREHDLQFYKDVAVVWIDVAENRDSMLDLEAKYYEIHKDTVLNDRPAETKDGEFNPKRRFVKCLTDGNEFATVSACAKHYGIRRTTLSNVLNGYKPNRFGLRFEFKGKEV